MNLKGVKDQRAREIRDEEGLEMKRSILVQPLMPPCDVLTLSQAYHHPDFS